MTNQSASFVANQLTTMAAFVPADKAALDAAITAELQMTMQNAEKRVETWVMWCQSGNWTQSDIAQSLCDSAAAGRRNGKVVNRDTFKNYARSLTALSRQLGDNPELLYVASLDNGVLDPAKKKAKKGHTVVGFRERATEATSSKGETLYRVACLFVKEAKRRELPLDADTPASELDFKEAQEPDLSGRSDKRDINLRVRPQLTEAELKGYSSASVDVAVNEGIKRGRKIANREAWKTVQQQREMIENHGYEIDRRDAEIEGLRSQLDALRVAVSAAKNVKEARALAAS